jgi:cytoskeletal protein CcmA (bactofilin family)
MAVEVDGTSIWIDLLNNSNRVLDANNDDFNIGIGYAVANNISEAQHNVMIGYQAAEYMTNARDNTIIGKHGGYEINAASDNVFIGTGAGANVVSSNYNVFVGKDAGRYSTGSQNMFLGTLAGSNNASFASNNTFVGREAGYENTGNNNVFVGLRTGYKNAGVDNMFLGSTAGEMNTEGSRNTLAGSNAGSMNMTGGNILALGADAGRDNQDSNNTYLGASAGALHQNGQYNLMVGAFAGELNRTGYENSFLGYAAGRETTLGTFRNVAVGHRAGHANRGNVSVFLGAGSGSSGTAQESILVGNGCGSNATVSQTVAFGRDAIRDASGTYNVVLGDGASPNLTGDHNAILGSANVTVANRSVVVGDPEVASIESSVLVLPSGRADIQRASNVVLISPSMATPVADLKNTVVLGTLPQGATVANDSIYVSVPDKVLLQANAQTMHLAGNVQVEGSLKVSGNIAIDGFDIPVYWDQVLERPVALSEFDNDITVEWSNVTSVPSTLVDAVDNSLIQKIVTENPQGTLGVSLGGTGKSSYAANGVLFADAQGTALATDAALSFDASIDTLTLLGAAVFVTPDTDTSVQIFDGAVFAEKGYATLEAGTVVDAQGNWVGQSLPVDRGGTGRETLAKNALLLGNASDSVETSTLLTFDPAVANLTVQGNVVATQGIDASDVFATRLRASDTATAQAFAVGSTTVINSQGEWRGSTVSVAYGGTGLQEVPMGRIPFGLNATSLETSPSLFFDSASGTLATDILFSDSLIISGQETIDSSRNWVGATIPVSQGGTGRTKYFSGEILVGGEDSIEQFGSLRFENDNLAVYGSALISNVENGNAVFIDDGVVMAMGGFSVGEQTSIDSQGRWSGPDIRVSHGGTGSSTFPENAVILGNVQGPLKTSELLTFDPEPGNLSTRGLQVHQHASVGGSLTATGNIQGASVLATSLLESSGDLVFQGKAKAGTLDVISSDGHWVGQTIQVAKGGTGRTGFSVENGLLVGSSSTIDQYAGLTYDTTSKVLQVASNGVLRVIDGDNMASGGDSVVIQGGVVDASQSFAVGSQEVIDVGRRWRGDTIDVEYGGTGATSFATGQVLLGNNSGPVRTSASLKFDTETNTLEVSGTIKATNLVYESLQENVTQTGNVAFSNVIINQGLYVSNPGEEGNLLVINSVGDWLGRTIPVEQGGTGKTGFLPGEILVGGEGSIDQFGSLRFEDDVLSVQGAALFSNAATGNVVILDDGVVKAVGGFSVGLDAGAQASIDSLGRWSGPDIRVSHGGTGGNAFPENAVILGNVQGPLKASELLKFNPDTGDMILMGNLEVQNLSVAGATGSGSAAAFDSISTGSLAIGETVVIDGDLNWGGATIPVTKGGTGLTNMTQGNILIGNGTGNVVESSDLSFSNNALLAKGNLVVQAKGQSSTRVTLEDGSVTVSHYLKTVAHGTVIDGTGNWKGKTIPTSKGGTGLETLPQDKILLGNGTSAVKTLEGLSYDASNDRVALDGLDLRISNSTTSEFNVADGRILWIRDDGRSPPAAGPLGDNGARVVLHPGGAETHAYALGLESQGAWFGVPTANAHSFYVADDPVLRADSQGLQVFIPGSTAPVATVAENVAAGSFKIWDAPDRSTSRTVITDQGAWEGSTISAGRGGTGLSAVPSGRILFGGTDAGNLNTSANMVFVDDELRVQGNVITTNLTVNGSLTGDFTLTQSFQQVEVDGELVIDGSGNWTGNVIPVAKGGTATGALNPGSIMVGNGSDAVLTPQELVWSDAYKALGVGLTPTSAEYRVDVDGKVRSSQGFLLSSDARLKTDLAGIDSALDKVRKISGYTYRRLNDPAREAGVMAQEIEGVLEEAVFTDAITGYKSVSYPGIVALLIEAVKELAQRVGA